MYVQKDVTGWLVCQEDGDILKSFKSKSAATKWLRDMRDAERPSMLQKAQAVPPSPYAATIRKRLGY